VIRQLASVMPICAMSLAADEAAQPSLTVYNQNFAVVRAGASPRSEGGG